MTTEQIIGFSIIGIVLFVAVGVVCYVLGYEAGRGE
jgi:hypothetical protein